MMASNSLVSLKDSPSFSGICHTGKKHGESTLFILQLTCHDHAQKGVGLYFLFTISIFPVPPLRTFQNTLRHPL